MTLPLRPLIVGESNPYQSDAESGYCYAMFPEPENSAGGRLCRLIMRMNTHDYLRAFDRTNLCHGKWSVPRARMRARELAAERRDERLGLASVIICCGVKVAVAFGLPTEPFKLYYAASPPTYVVLPHPSGLCRVWNELRAVERARDVLRQAGLLL